ncbi:hypothetical protein [Croceimicrobium sp.]|uniref:hypothetical protein n=1 Tax=Croceimicrobium sp. TaxID=2828340 RepID=UPI003BAC2253
MLKHLSTLLLLTIGFTGYAQQISPNALGLRLGGSNGFGTEVSYQRKLSNMNRLQVDLGLKDNRAVDAILITANYQWVKPLNALSPDFQWFYGAGGGLGFVDYDNVPLEDDGKTVLVVEGIFGLEYSFLNVADLPLQIALDVNPAVNLLNDAFDDFDLDLALSLRWQF